MTTLNSPNPRQRRYMARERDARQREYWTLQRHIDIQGRRLCTECRQDRASGHCSCETFTAPSYRRR